MKKKDLKLYRVICEETVIEKFEATVWASNKTEARKQIKRQNTNTEDAISARAVGDWKIVSAPVQVCQRKKDTYEY